MLKAYKFRIVPNMSQTKLIEKHFGSTRFLYNYFLERSASKSLKRSEMQKGIVELKSLESYKWLKEINSQSLQVTTHELDEAFKRFFKKSGGYPKFKSRKHTHQSFSIPQNIKIIKQKLYIPKFTKNPITIKLHRQIPKSATIKSATISRHNSKYYISILIDDNIEVKPLSKISSSVGIDLGLTDLAILPNGNKIENRRFFIKSEKRLAYLQRQLSKKRKGSQNREKIKLKVQKLHDKITNQRKDYLHKITDSITKRYDFIAVETLKSANMMKNRKLSKAISDASWYELVRQLEYKAKWRGKWFVKIDQFFPSSKLCSCCGTKADTMPLNIREWSCQSCHTTHDRDINASINIERQGLALLPVEVEILVSPTKQEAPSKLAFAS